MEAPGDGEAHQPLGPKPVESANTEDGQSARASMSTPTLSTPAPDVAMTSTRLVEDEEVIPITGLGTQL